MSEVTITNIQAGEPFTLDDGGTLIPHTYAFSDNITGVAYHKSQMPFSQGDTVWREVTGTVKGGQLKGLNKIKLRKEAPQEGGYAQNSGTPRQGMAQRVQGSKRDGMQVGNITTNAIALITSGVIRDSGNNPVTVPLDHVPDLVWKTMSAIAIAVDQFEAGNIAGRPVDEPKGPPSNIKRPTEAEFAAAAASVTYDDSPNEVPKDTSVPVEQTPPAGDKPTF